MTHRPDCPHCRAHESVVVPSRLAWLAHAAAWVYAFVSVYGAILTGPIIIGLIPPLFVGGMCLVTTTYERATAPAVCSACERIVVAPGRATTASRFEMTHRHA